VRERPLSVAAEAGDVEIVEPLIARGAKINSEVATAALNESQHDLARMLIGQGGITFLAATPRCTTPCIPARPGS
jgi:Ankyrin repeat